MGEPERETSPFVHRDVDDRLDVVHRLGSATGRSRALDRLTDLAARLLGTDHAQVSLVDDQHTVVGWSGPATSWSEVAIPAADSLCALTVEGRQVLAVEDAAVDERVGHLPPVLSGEVGAYLGVPLVSAGHVVGALCAIHPRSRSWRAGDQQVLETLGQAVVAELELAALEAAYANDRLLWELAVDAAEVGVFDWDLATGRLRWDDRLLQVFGLTHDSFGGTIEAFDAAVHPDDRERVGRALDRAIDTCGEYVAEYRIVVPGGAERWVFARGRALEGPGGRAARVVGAAYDTTAVQEGEARYSRVLDTMPTALLHLDPENRLGYANPHAARLLGAGVEAGDPLVRALPPPVSAVLEPACRRAVESREPVVTEVAWPGGSRFEVRAWPTPDGVSVYLVDVTEQSLARQAVQHAAERATLLAEVTRALTDTLDVGEAARRLTRLLVPALGRWCLVGLVDPDATDAPRRIRQVLDVASWHADPAQRERLTRYAAVVADALVESSPAAQAVRTGTAVLVDDPAQLHASVRPGEAADLGLDLAPAVSLLLPLSGRGRVIGLLTVTRGQDDPPFSDDDVEALTDVAARAGLALDNLRAYAEQRDLAEVLQRSLLSAPPEVPGLDIAVRYEPATRAAQVGGDWYDAFPGPDGDLTLVIGDVMGHDFASAAAMGQVRGLLRGVAVAGQDGPAGTLRRLDVALRALRVETTATAVLASLGPDAVLRWSNAGHPPPVLVAPGADGAWEVRLLWAAQADLLLGLDPEAVRRETEVPLVPGATVLFYTDGLVERRGEGLDDGLARLTDALGDLASDVLPLGDWLDAVLARVLPPAPDDDVALLAVRVT